MGKRVEAQARCCHVSKAFSCYSAPDKNLILIYNINLIYNIILIHTIILIYNINHYYKKLFCT